MRTFADISNDIVRGMDLSKKAMIEEGLWNDTTTFEEWSNYAGSHIRIVEASAEEELFPPGITNYGLL